jgi:hypothetical protein
MAKLKTKNVFIDTEVFDAANLNFESATFKELVRLVQGGFVKVFMTSITKAEVKAHIREQIRNAGFGLKRFRKDKRILRNVSACESLFKDFDEEAAVKEIEQKFETFIVDADVTVLDLRHNDADAIFESYFRMKPPFGDGKKKYEFPDAFAQEALTKWCERNNSEMYVVSADSDWQSTDKRLIPLRMLKEFIDAAVTDQAKELSEVVMSLYEKHLDKVKEAITEAFQNSGFYTDDVDGDVNEVKVTHLDVNDPQLIEVEEGLATISVSVNLDYEADVSYEDDDEGIWDGEDHRWFYRPTKHVEVEESENFEAELEVQFDMDTDVFDVACSSFGKDFSVTVLPSDYELK